MQLLNELNQDVTGDFVDDNIESILLNQPDFFQPFSVVVAVGGGGGITEKCLIALSERLWELNIPFLFCRSVGFFATARLQVKEHCIVEMHPDNRQSDLRLEHPFETLRAHLQRTELSLKVPWLVILYQFMQKWSDTNDGRLPQTYKEKTELRNLIRDGMGAVHLFKICFNGS